MQKTSKNNISIVIVNYNSGKLLVECLKNIFTSEINQGIETIVIDNASNDNSLLNAEKIFAQVKYIKNNKNLGFSKAVNQGIKLASSDFILLLNPDALVNLDNLLKMHNFLCSISNAGIVGPKLLNEDGSIQLSCRSFPTFVNAIFNRYSFFTRLFPKNRYSRKYLYTDWNHDHFRKVDWVSGACLLARKEALEQIGLLDEDYFMYCEDIDLCYRAKHANWDTYYYPEVSVKHLIRGGEKRASLKSILDHHMSMYIFYKKNYNKGLFIRNLYSAIFLVMSFFCMVGYKKLMRAN